MLGTKLRDIILTEELADALSEQLALDSQRKARSEQLANQRKDQVLAFISAAKFHISSSIERGSRPLPLEIPQGSPFDSHLWGKRDMIGSFSQSSHREAYLFNDFFNWGHEQGLLISFKYKVHMNDVYEVQVAVK